MASLAPAKLAPASLLLLRFISIFRHASVSSTHPAKTGITVVLRRITVVLRRITVVLRHFFSGFPFCHCLWALTKCRNDIVVATITKEVTTITKKVSPITKKVTTITKEVATISKEVVTITNELTTITKEVATITKLFWAKVFSSRSFWKAQIQAEAYPDLLVFY